VGWVLVFPSFYGEALGDRACDREFIEAYGTFPDKGLGLDMDGRDGSFDFEGMNWGGFECSADKAEDTALDSF